MENANGCAGGEWSVLRRERLVDSAWVQVDVEDVRLPDGLRLDDYYIVREPDFAMVMAITDDDRVLLVRQYKHGIARSILELPAGLIEAEDQSVDEAIRRELREETGYEAGAMVRLGTLVVSPTRSPTRGHYYLAIGCRRVGNQVLDRAERIEVVPVDLGELPSLVMMGAIDGQSSVAAIFLGLQALAQRTTSG